jgi:L-ascorbate metabolism protein UlaG (beta-lactamase superfamily)
VVFLQHGGYIMKITYVHHSCFSVEFKDIVLLFDYYKGMIPKFDINKHIFVFSSHKHHDHFDLKIFDLAKEYENITFVLSSDIRMSASYMERNHIDETLQKRIMYIGKNEKKNIPILSSSDINQSFFVETLTSTDEGVAFVISYDNKVIYHAGDLNWWTWPGETDEEYNDMTTRFMREMDKLKAKDIDVAFVPLDPRQEERFFMGFDSFMKMTNTKWVFPMHFWLDYSIIDKLKRLDVSQKYVDKIMDITYEGQEYTL